MINTEITKKTPLLQTLIEDKKFLWKNIIPPEDYLNYYIERSNEIVTSIGFCIKLKIDVLDVFKKQFIYYSSGQYGETPVMFFSFIAEDRTAVGTFGVMNYHNEYDPHLTKISLGVKTLDPLVHSKLFKKIKPFIIMEEKSMGFNKPGFAFNP